MRRGGVQAEMAAGACGDCTAGLPRHPFWDRGGPSGAWQYAYRYARTYAGIVRNLYTLYMNLFKLLVVTPPRFCCQARSTHSPIASKHSLHSRTAILPSCLPAPLSGGSELTAGPSCSWLAVCPPKSEDSCLSSARSPCNSNTHRQRTPFFSQ